MLTDEAQMEIRVLSRRGMGVCAIARELGISRNTVWRYLRGEAVREPSAPGPGIRFQRLLTDNGACYKSRRFRRLWHRVRLKHKRTKPYTPRTNGKAERYIQTSLWEWAYARAYAFSEQRARHLLPWLCDYNWHRPHASLGCLPPINRMPTVNNLVALHS